MKGNCAHREWIAGALALAVAILFSGSGYSQQPSPPGFPGPGEMGMGPGMGIPPGIPGAAAKTNTSASQITIFQEEGRQELLKFKFRDPFWPPGMTAKAMERYAQAQKSGKVVREEVVKPIPEEKVDWQAAAAEVVKQGSIIKGPAGQVFFVNSQVVEPGGKLVHNRGAYVYTFQLVEITKNRTIKLNPVGEPVPR